MDVEFNYEELLKDVEEFCRSLSNYNILIMDNNDPDVRVVEVNNDLGVSQVIQREFGDLPVVQSIITNMDYDTRVRVPYFRVAFAVQPGPDPPVINFKLQSFYRKIGMSLLNARCGKTVVVGLHAVDDLESPLSIPFAFCNTSIDPLEFTCDHEVDMACLKPCAPCAPGTTLCDIAGLCLPVYVPPEVQMKILLYLENPTASLIKKRIDDLCIQWDRGLYLMWKQREPRIPAHIASIYNVSNVHKAIVVATRSCLVPHVP